MKYKASSLIEYQGEKKTTSQWAKEKHIHVSTLTSRLNESGWSIDKAIETPKQLQPVGRRMQDQGRELRDNIRESLLKVWRKAGKEEFEKQLLAAFHTDALKVVKDFALYLPKDTPSEVGKTVENLAIKIELAPQQEKYIEITKGASE